MLDVRRTQHSLRGLLSTARTRGTTPTRARVGRRTVLLAHDGETYHVVFPAGFANTGEPVVFTGTNQKRLAERLAVALR